MGQGRVDRITSYNVCYTKLLREQIFYGDVNRPEILERVGVGRARILVLAISDPMATRRAVAIARRSNPNLFILV